MAHSMFVLDNPRLDPEAAQNIAYQTSIDFVNTEIVKYESEGKLDDPEYNHLLGVREYLDVLEEKRMSDDPRRTRYDYLRSEYAVATSMAFLRKELGQGASWGILDTMASLDKAVTLGRLVEGFVDRYPHLKNQVYQGLAESSGEILVTKAEAKFVAELGGDWQIDIDRDGVTPGFNQANVEYAGEFYQNETLFQDEPAPLPNRPDPLFFEESAGSSPAVAPDHFHSELPFPEASQDELTNVFRRAPWMIDGGLLGVPW